MKKNAAVTVFGLLLVCALFLGVLCAPNGGYGAVYYGYGGYYGGYYYPPYYGWYGVGPWGYPYAYPYYAPYYEYPYSAYPPLDNQIAVPSEPQQSYWYHCQDPEGYYPYVKSCPGGWAQVVPTPPEPGKEGATQ